jgi:multidrug efflux system membrane fusion protein
VKKGDLLFAIDRRPFEHRVDLLTAKRVQAVQQVAQLEAELSAAKAEGTRLVAEEVYARAVHGQEKEIYKEDATTDRKYLDAIQKYKAAQAALERSRAQVRKAEQALAARIGTEHALVAEVEAQLAEARLNLDWTRIYALCTGYVTNVQLRQGSYVHVGVPVLTCINTDQWLVVANFRERSLERLQQGQPALVAFQAAPGRLYRARVSCIGWGVNTGQGVPSGLLPEVKNQTSWIPPAQRFQVRLALEEPSEVPLRVSMTGSVSVYPDPESSLKDLTRGIHQLVAWFYYL